MVVKKKKFGVGGRLGENPALGQEKIVMMDGRALGLRTRPFQCQASDCCEEKRGGFLLGPQGMSRYLVLQSPQIARISPWSLRKGLGFGKV